MILDIGCGEVPRGDVNVDLNIDSSIHRGSKLNVKKIPNFVLADAQHLPFKSACFEKVRSSHVIEHVPNPMLMLQEMTRVSSRYVLVRCPHRFNLKIRRNESHRNKFGCGWFKQAFGMLNCRLIHNDVRPSLFGFPEEIMVKAEKA